MRKGRDGEMENWKKNNGEDSGHYVVASQPPNGDRLQRRRSCQFYQKLLKHHILKVKQSKTIFPMQK